MFRDLYAHLVVLYLSLTPSAAFAAYDDSSVPNSPRQTGAHSTLELRFESHADRDMWHDGLVKHLQALVAELQVDAVDADDSIQEVALDGVSAQSGGESAVVEPAVANETQADISVPRPAAASELPPSSPMDDSVSSHAADADAVAIIKVASSAFAVFSVAVESVLPPPPPIEAVIVEPVESALLASALADACVASLPPPPPLPEVPASIAAVAESASADIRLDIPQQGWLRREIGGVFRPRFVLVVDFSVYDSESLIELADDGIGSDSDIQLFGLASMLSIGAAPNQGGNDDCFDIAFFNLETGHNETWRYQCESSAQRDEWCAHIRALIQQAGTVSVPPPQSESEPAPQPVSQPGPQPVSELAPALASTSEAASAPLPVPAPASTAESAPSESTMASNAMSSSPVQLVGAADFSASAAVGAAPHLAGWFEMKSERDADFRRLFGIVLDYSLYWSDSVILVDDQDISSDGDVQSFPLVSMSEIVVHQDSTADGARQFDFNMIDAEVSFDCILTRWLCFQHALLSWCFCISNISCSTRVHAARPDRQGFHPHVSLCRARRARTLAHWPARTGGGADCRGERRRGWCLGRAIPVDGGKDCRG